MLRCRPGDVAMVTGITSIEVRQAGALIERIAPVAPLGAMVTVVALRGDDDIWMLAEPLLCHVKGLPFHIDGLGDSVLTPYRPWERDERDTPVREPERAEDFAHGCLRSGTGRFFAPGASVLGAPLLHSGSSAARRRYSARHALYTRAISTAIDRLAQSSSAMAHCIPRRATSHAIPAAEIAAPRSAA